MRGVVTIAGEGTRMLPWTRGLRKEFLPLYDRAENGETVLKPVAHVVLETMVAAGVDDVTLVVGAKDLAFVQNYFTIDRQLLHRHAHHAERLAETERFYDTLRGLRLRFAVQPAPRGFGDAVAHAEEYVGDGPFVLQAGDGVLIERERGNLLRTMSGLLEREHLDAVLLVRKVADPRRYGVVEGRAEGREGGLKRLVVTGMEEKPAKPRSQWAATAAYAFSHRVFDALRALEGTGPTGEIELTDAIRRLIADGAVAALVLAPSAGEWRSVGSPEGFQRALEQTRKLAQLPKRADP
ncbi:MAG TPA: sugar phosphate nucleotidyltransferase [Thermoplasmata archaeon]|nr:sugar phosphate nucleotidyltransferase [Thermoplasmata archaeon]